VFLPQRQHLEGFSAEQTYKPPKYLFAVRGVIEFFRVTVPATFFVALTTTLIVFVTSLRDRAGVGAVILLFPALFIACAWAAALGVVALKWLIMGRYKPGEKALWSPFVWLNEFITALHEHVADPLVVQPMLGTPFATWFFRLMGVKFGRRTHLHTTQFTEYDLIKVGDDVALNPDCTIQTHLFEDRVMKLGTIDIGDRCSVGPMAVVLYDTVMEPDSQLAQLSLLMKGETLPAGSHWEGTPARAASAPPVEEAGTGSVPAGAVAAAPER
jgi:non-ribosomal peptide synthetase-like protein